MVISWMGIIVIATCIIICCPKPTPIPTKYSAIKKQPVIVIYDKGYAGV